MIRVFPRKTKWIPTDGLVFVGYPPMIRPADDQPVHISVTFTWDVALGLRIFEAWKQYYSEVQIGGVAFNDPGGEFIPGRYVKQGVIITSRGCPHNCPWCFIPQREGKIRELPIKDGWIIQDNNLLGCSRGHIEAVFDMLRLQPRRAEFKGGLDGRLLRPWHIDLLHGVKVGEMWFSYDHPSQLKTLEKVAEMLVDFRRQQKRCYVMVGYDGEIIADAERRLEKAYSLGFDPFCQLYQSGTKIKYSGDWRDLARKWSRPALYRRGQQ